MDPGRAQGVPGAPLTEALLGLGPSPLGWTFEPSVIAGIAGAGLLFVLQRRRPGGGDRGQALYFWSALVALTIALVSPLDAAADHYLLSAHMLQHILLTMVGPPLLLAGLPAMSFSTRRVNPWLAVAIFNGVLLAWHWPALYEATLRDPLLHVLEHLMFMATAFVFWWPIVGPGSRGERRMSPLMKVGYLAFAGVPPTVVGITMAFVPTVLYPFYTAAPRLLAGVSPQLDQQLAGILMFGIGNLIYFVPITRNFFRIAEEAEVLPA